MTTPSASIEIYCVERKAKTAPKSSVKLTRTQMVWPCSLAVRV